MNARIVGKTLPKNPSIRENQPVSGGVGHKYLGRNYSMRHKNKEVQSGRPSRLEKFRPFGHFLPKSACGFLLLGLEPPSPAAQ
jgi:hypothetical protein